MDDLNPQQLEELRRSLERLGLSADQIESSIRAMDKAAKDAGRSLANVIKSLSKLDKDISTNRATIMGLAGEMLKGQRKYKDLSGQLDLLDEKIEELADTTDSAEIAIRGELIQRRESIQKLTQENEARRAVVNGLTKFTKDVASVGGRTAAGLVRNIQDNASAFTTAGGLMDGMIDTANAGMQTIGTGLTTVGTTLLTNTNPRVRMLGYASTGAGIAISKLSDAAAAAGKVIVNYMVKQIEMTVDSFNKASSSGALFADGMTGLVNSATDAGLTVKQFGDVLKSNSDVIAQSGLGVSEGARQIGRVGKTMRESGITDQLLKLGFGFEEQAGLVAEVVASMRRTAGGTPSDKEVAIQTAKYAENLRIIAGVTGEDARKKVEAARQENQILAFQIELAKKTPEQRAAIDAAMATMTEQEKKNFRDRVVLGDVINTEGAIYEATVAGAREKGLAALKLFDQNRLTAETNAQLNAEYGEQIKRSALAQKDFATAGMVVGGEIGNVSKAMLDAVNQTNIYSKDAVNTSIDTVGKQKNATDDFTKGVVKAAHEAQLLATRLQDITLKQLGNFAYYSGQIIEALREQLDKLGIKTEGPGGPPKFSFGEMFKAGATGAATLGSFGAMAGATAGGVGAVPGGLIGGALGFLGGAGGSLVDQLYYGGRTFGSTATPGAIPGTGPTAAGAEKLSNVVQFGPNTGSERHFNMLSGDAQSRFVAMAQEYYSVTGKKLQINSSYRSAEEQASINSGGNPKAEPGRSLHQQGRALDLNSSDVAALKISGLLGKYGFRTIANDPPHIELMAKGGITDGPSIAGEAGPEAVVPLPDGRNIPVKMDVRELVKKLDEMIDILREGNGNTEKIFYASVQ